MRPPDTISPDLLAELPALLARLRRLPSIRVSQAAEPALALERLLADMQAENRLLPVQIVETLLGIGFLLPEDVPLLAYLQLAPGVIVAADRLRWEPQSQQLVFVNDDGGRRGLDRLFRYLTYGGDENAWVEAQPAAGGDGAAASCGNAGAPRLQRVVLELGTIIAVKPAPGLADRVPRPIPGLPLQVDAGGPFIVVDVHGRWLFVDRSTATRAVRPSVCDAAQAADAALLGEDDRYCWLDLHDADDPEDA